MGQIWSHIEKLYMFLLEIWDVPWRISMATALSRGLQTIDDAPLLPHILMEDVTYVRRLHPSHNIMIDHEDPYHNVICYRSDCFTYVC